MIPLAARLDGWLIAVCLGRIFVHANFLVYAACMPILAQTWSMSATQAGTVASGFTIGYALSLVASAWLAERLGARRVFLGSAAASAVAAIGFAAFATDYASAVVLYTLAALPQGGIYTPGIMLMAEHYPAERRGYAVGWLLASTSLGLAFSLVVSGWLVGLGGPRVAFLGTGLLPAAGAAILWWAMRDTPNVIHAHGGRASVLSLLRARPNARRLVAGYAWHSWEVLGMWVWMPAFLAASIALNGADRQHAAEIAAYLAGGMHVVGAFASSSMGRMSDRIGRRRVMIVLAVTGALCSSGIGFLVAAPLALLVVLVFVYGFVAIGDSPVLSAAITEEVAPAQLGSVLAIRALLGFGAGAVSPILFGGVLDFARSAQAPAAAWGLAFAVFGVGGWVAAWCALRLEAAHAYTRDRPISPGRNGKNGAPGET